MRIGTPGLCLTVILGTGALGAREETPRPASSPTQGNASVTGTVKIAGEIPPRKKVKMDTDPKCKAMHGEDQWADEVVADAEGRVRWAFVYVKKGL